jgi:hypothetical protein
MNPTYNIILFQRLIQNENLGIRSGASTLFAHFEIPVKMLEARIEDCTDCLSAEFVTILSHASMDVMAGLFDLTVLSTRLAAYLEIQHKIIQIAVVNEDEHVRLLEFFIDSFLWSHIRRSNRCAFQIATECMAIFDINQMLMSALLNHGIYQELSLRPSNQRTNEPFIPTFNLISIGQNEGDRRLL